jgi:hypothetical protein
MIRERVSTRGECRPLEDPKDLPGLNVPLDEIGVVKEAQVSLAGVPYLRKQLNDPSIYRPSDTFVVR